MKTTIIHHRARTILVLNILLGISTVLAVASLIMEYGGFDTSSLPLPKNLLVIMQRFIVGFFIFDRVIRLLLAKSRKDYFKNNWVDYALITLFLLALVVTYRYRSDFVAAGLLFVIITQIYMLAMLLMRAVSANIKLAGSGLPPSWLLIGSFATICFIGSGLLMLPVSVRSEFHETWSYADALFTSISATCVTGLIVVDTGTHFTPFGQAIILTMIQLGGLGIMIFGTVLAMLAGKALTVRSSDTIGEMMAYDKPGELGRVIRFAVLVTFLLEILGAILLLQVFFNPAVRDGWGNALSPAGAVWHAIFHSISAFCNAGFSLYSNNMMQGVREGWASPLRSHWQMMGVFVPLIILGGLGFPVLLDCWGYLCSLPRRMRRRFGQKPMFRSDGQQENSDKPQPLKRISLHTRIVLTCTVLLIILGAVGLWVLNTRYDQSAQPNRFGPTVKDKQVSAADSWDQLSGGQKVRESIFQSVTARTAGFNTIDMNSQTNGGKLWLCMLMTIGGSPAGTAGGVKTVTIAMLFLAAWSILRRRGELEAYHRSIPEVLLRRAVTIVLLYMALLIVITFLLCSIMQNEKFIDLFFEASSACGTVGLSTGVTGRLDFWGKHVIMVGMFIGRVGPLTLLLALMVGAKNIKYSYPPENVLIG